MKLIKKKTVRRVRRMRSVRGTLRAHPGRPRLSVYRSHKHISVQVIDDTKGETLCSASSLEKDLRRSAPNAEAGSSEKAPTEKKRTKSDLSKVVGETVAKRALEKGIKTVVFDRGAYRYHGRVRVLADAARKAGLQF